MLVKLIVFPKEGRTGEPKPLFKKSSNTTPKNYRPFPLMLAVFKITEKSILLISILFKSAQLEDCKNMAYSANINQVLEQVFQLIRA